MTDAAQKARSKVVALLPAWNAEPFIGETLDALAAQTYDDFEVLISVDLSTDRTAEICEAYAAKDARFSVIRQTGRQGWTGNVNALLTAANGDYFFFAFHDDTPAPEYVARLAAALDANPGAIVAYCDLETSFVDGRVKREVYRQMEDATDRVARCKRMLWQSGPWWIPHRGLFRASAARDIGGLKKHMAGEFWADWPWLVHMSLLGNFIRIPEYLCRKNFKKDSLSLKWRHDRRAYLGVALSCAREIGRAKIPVVEKLRLHATLIALSAREITRGATRH